MRMVLAVAALLAALPAAAQAQGSLMGRGPITPQTGAAPPREAPQGLPGVAARRGQRPIPAETDPSGMNPNDALFDGINRGDIGTVRDAINRGADVNARNALGLTALDSAVDQGRPEITVYLLSVRGTSSAPPPPSAAPQGRGAARPAPLPREASRREAAVPVQPAAQVRPRLFGNDGGTPRPEIGFLGFDAGRG
ncbi:ankyrin repeat domain-containing protein [Sabulicella glaciei]|uniref:Ankyrin repeat domain-containing protein n=1 Tax=Sabulicella glaciei TaxID=2984948 RepID=A0ABT3NV51_9PROT|nr:ankyrin repeat domain-containing protein [Roseococcus sp. MDT2-1-1]MCW8086043.1 ankyrin repeat domain-containing protein [Roseococcus sp. MDT2-1-1]